MTDAERIEYEGNEKSPEERTATEQHTWELQERFLAGYAGDGTVESGLEAAGIARRTERHWRQFDVLGFVRRKEEAHDRFCDRLEALAWERVKNPAGNRGSDVLLMGLLNANRPEKYRPNVHPTDENGLRILEELRAASRRSGRAAQGQPASSADVPVPQVYKDAWSRASQPDA